MEQFGLIEALCDGRAFGLVSRDSSRSRGRLSRAANASLLIFPRAVAVMAEASTMLRLRALSRVSRRFTLKRWLGRSLLPSAQAFTAPALPCRPSMPQSQRENNTHPLKPINVLLFETSAKEVKVQGLVHRLLDRKQWLGQPSAIECFRGEKDGSVNAGTWSESQIQSKADVLAWSRRASNSVHFGSLMVIVSVKWAEMTPDAWKVFRGNNFCDECSMSAVFEELYSSSPPPLEGLNTAIAFGLLESHGVSVSDAIKAYVQSELKSPAHTYVMLLPEVVPQDKKHIKDPCPRLCKDIRCPQLPGLFTWIPFSRV